MSWMVSDPATLATTRRFPDRETARTARLEISADVNQISDPSGDQAIPWALPNTGESVRFFSAVSTTAIDPPSSPALG
jgi:hypothetical protein